MLMVLAFQAARKVRSLLEVFLHMGAHRTGTTTFQRTLQQNHRDLSKNGVTFWGPRMTRGGMFSGLLRGDDAEAGETRRLIARNQGVIRLEMDRMQARGQKRLLVSEENMLGGLRANLRAQVLYPGLEARLARFAGAFGPVTTRIGLAIRPYETYWASAYAQGIPQGHRVPEEADLDRLVTQPRTWRHVIGDLARAFPRADIVVWEWDRLVARPRAQLALMAGPVRGLNLRAGQDRHNASAPREVLRAMVADRGGDAFRRIAEGTGPYQPFDQHHIEALQARYREDLTWLRGVSVGRLKFVDEVEKIGLGRMGHERRGFG
jgi:hypothetical protein